MNAALFTKSTTGLILASGLIAASSVLGHAQDAPMGLGTLATYPLSAAYATVPTGQASLGGHTFDMTSGNMVKLATNASASFAGSYQNPTAVHLLLNSANTYSWYAGTPVGTVVLTFSDGTTQTATLTVGGNVREWYIGGFGVVNSVSDVTPSTTTPYSSQVWTTTVLGGTASPDTAAGQRLPPAGQLVQHAGGTEQPGDQVAGADRRTSDRRTDRQRQARQQR